MFLFLTPIYGGLSLSWRSCKYKLTIINFYLQKFVLNTYVHMLIAIEIGWVHHEITNFNELMKLLS